MDKKALIIVIMGILILAPVGVLSYGYANYSSQIYPAKNPLAVKKVIIPYNQKEYPISLQSYLTGDPAVDLNITLRSIYERATIIIGDPSFKDCKGEACVWRTRTASELGATIGALMGRKYYYEALMKGEDNSTAAAIASKEARARVDVKYLAFFPKAMIGIGRIGNKKHLLVMLVGPKEGATVNRIYAPKPGVLILEATDEETLFAEVLLVKTIINSQVKG